MTDSEQSIVLDVPVQHLDAPRFCGADPAALSQWAEALPRGDIGETSRQLFEALQELNSCKLTAELRFKLLEVLRPLVYSACSSLGIHYHNQPIVLPAHAFQVYLLSQTMQMQLATGYQIVAHDAAAATRGILKKKTRNPQLMAHALHRAISDLAYTLFRGCLIYSEPAPGVWRQLHTLYRFSASHEAGEHKFKDQETGQVYPITIDQCYTRALMLGSVRSSQLRQEDLNLVFDFLGEWVTMTAIADYDGIDEDHIVVNLESDEPPVFQALFLEPAGTTRCRVLRLDELLHRLGEMLADKNCKALSHDLIKHLLVSWSSYTRRTFMRMESRDSLQLCIGMSNLHYFSADGVEFESFVQGKIHKTFQGDAESNPFLKHEATMRHEDRDLWSQPFTAGPSAADIALESIDNHIRQFERDNATEKSARHYDHHQIEMKNVSPGGYALEWTSGAGASLSNGDIVGIRESSHNTWSVGIISWMRRGTGHMAQIGVKLLSPSAIPYAARVINRGPPAANDGKDDFRRVLLLPQIKLIGQPATLLTDQLSFREKQTLQLVQQGRTITVRLKKMLSATGAIKQFDIEVVDKPWQNNYGTEARRDRFDALWNSL